MERAKKFYSEVLAVELEPLGDPTDASIQMMAFPSDMEQYGAAGALVKMPDVSAGGHSTMVYFGSEDCAVEAERIAAAGGTLLQKKMDIGDYGYVTIATDTEGNRFGLHSMA